MNWAIKVFKSLGLVSLLVSLLPSLGFAQYVRTNLVSNQEGVAPNTDSQHLVNAWGLTQLGTSPFWVSDNGTGFSTLYTGTGQQIPLFVTIPPAPNSAEGTPGMPTGTVGNISPNPNDFTIIEHRKSGQSIFIFATLDGTISGWNPTVDGVSATGASHATIAVNRSKVGAVYSGLAIATDTDGQTFLYAADDGQNRRVDMFDGTFTLVKSFNDPAIPQNFAPYGIQAINGDIWVTYTALTNAPGGFVDVFDLDGRLKTHLAVQGPLNSPWGLAQAPADFGPMSNAILVSNNVTRGQINAFDPTSGEFLGPLRDANGQPINIDNVWAIQFGHDGGPGTAHNQLFFTAGPDNYGNGLFGVITVAP
jgi:uncharacterized protein (TIGR03118 family)